MHKTCAADKRIENQTATTAQRITKTYTSRFTKQIPHFPFSFILRVNIINPLLTSMAYGLGWLHGATNEETEKLPTILDGVHFVGCIVCCHRVCFLFLLLYSPAFLLIFLIFEKVIFKLLNGK